MSEIRSTRLRHVSAASLEVAEAFINALKFKVEIKNIVFTDKWYVIFAVSDNIIDFVSLDLDIIS